MIFKSIEFKREKESDWENGFFIEKGEESICLDMKLNPVTDHKNNKLVWDYRCSEGFNFDFPIEKEYNYEIER
jgi:hypothetical protein